MSGSLSGCVVQALRNEVDSICLVRECRELDENFGTCFTEAITSKNSCCLREMKKAIMEVDRRSLLERCEEKVPMGAKVAECPGWAKLWDYALDLGWKAVAGLQMVSRAMSHHGRGNHPCHLCDDPTLLKDTVLDHILTTHHQELHLNNSNSFSSLDLLGMLENLNVEILPKFKNIFHTWI